MSGKYIMKILLPSFHCECNRVLKIFLP